MKRFLALLSLIVLTACSGAPNTVSPSPMNTPLPTATLVVSTSTEIPATETLSTTSTPGAEDLFNQTRITIPPPTCDAGPTPADTEGPYFKSGSPERISLIEENMQGTRLVLVGYVLDQNCQPTPNAMVDFWQANENGEYDNAGYTLRGHQFTDEQGRYYLETIMPGLYSSRPILHIHVKVQAPGAEVVTTQIYFPDQPVPNQTPTLEEREGYVVGYFNFVVER